MFYEILFGNILTKKYFFKTLSSSFDPNYFVRNWGKIIQEITGVNPIVESEFKRERFKGYLAFAISVFVLIVIIFFLFISIIIPQESENIRITRFEVDAKTQLNLNSSMFEIREISAIHNDDLNLNFILYDKAFLYYNSESKSQESFFYDIKKEEGNLLTVLTCNGFEENVREFRERFRGEPYFFEETEIRNYLGKLKMERVEKDFFNYANTNPICFVRNAPFSILTLRHEYRETYWPNELPAFENNLLPDFYYNYDPNSCMALLDFERKSDIDTTLNLIFLSIENKKFSSCKLLGYPDYINCNFERELENGVQINFYINEHLPKKGSFAITFDCNSDNST